MNTKYLMMFSAVILGAMGIGLTFLPEEISEFIGINTNQNSILVLQILGSNYLGFSLLNWMTKDNLIGGIYSRPLVIGNLVHYSVSSIAIIKIVLKSESPSGIILTFAIIYSVLALCFGYIFMANPFKLNKTE